MTYGIDVSGTEIRWVRFSAESNMATCGSIPLDERSSTYTLKQTVKRLFATKKIRSFVYPIWGVGVRAKLFGSNKVDISELEDHIAWEARFMIDYNESVDVLSFAALRSVGKETWIVASAAPRKDVIGKLELFPYPPELVDTALTSLANALLASRWGKRAPILLHLDRTRAFLVIVSHGDPILMQEIFNVRLMDMRLDKDMLTWWQDELKLRCNFLPADKRSLDGLLLSGEAALEPDNARALGDRLNLEAEIFNPFEGVNLVDDDTKQPIYTLAYSSAMRAEE